MENLNNFFENTIDINDNLSKYNKESLKMAINHIINLFTKYNVDIPIENASALLSGLNIIKNRPYDDFTQEISNRAYYYDFNKNTLIDNSRNVRDYDRRLYDYFVSILDIMSKKYNPDISKYSDGLVYEDENGNKFGRKINEKLKHRLVTLITGEVIDEEKIEDFYVDKANDPCTLEDYLLIDINSIIDTEELLSFYINGDGISFYQKIYSMLDNNENIAKDFLSNIDSYTKENSIEHREKYDATINQLKDKKHEEENGKKIA